MKMPYLIESFQNFKGHTSVEQLKVINDIFIKAGSFKLEHKNVRYKNFVYEGISLELFPKLENNTLTEEEKNVLKLLVENNLENSKTEEEKTYYETLKTLIDNINYLTKDEQFTLKIIFDSMNKFDETLLQTDINSHEYAIKKTFK